jgi:hypothetical protein
MNAICQSAKEIAAQPRAQLEDFGKGIHTANERLQTAIRRLQALHGRIYGPAPEGTGNKPSTQSLVGAASFLRAELEDLHAKLDTTDSLLEQLERFV